MSRSTSAAALLLALVLPAGAAELPLADRLALLAAAWPAAGIAVERNLLRLPGHDAIVIEDGRDKSHEERLRDADIEDMLAQGYPPGPCWSPPARNDDPGRIRSESFFRALFGATRAEVRASLRPLDWFGERLMVTERHGVHAALARVRDRLAGEPGLRRFLVPSAGTFNWRVIAGTNRLSVHSFGAAIDLNTAFGDYWLWSRDRTEPPRPRYPMEIVVAFEAEGFVWGGRWWHYDTMHFEYRPELLAIARAEGRSACR